MCVCYWTSRDRFVRALLSEFFFAFLRSFNPLAVLLSYKGFLQFTARFVPGGYLAFVGLWFNYRCSFSTSLRLMIASNSWRISLKLSRRSRVLTPSQPPFHLYVMPFRSQERFTILGRHPPTWWPWYERPGLLPMRKQTTMPQS